ncbi:hypothetical protein WICPIJ_006055 [Wickerhamomyces pijperi]|uniref:Uncharacterized protein n=1 Tax=Wickerhamomyces pijperi TaxID=599730 RepID=A0A9P8TKJ2_WICPI|nr:hypothetical protein WICPIJ_006055 [Wickerhamomyces pijperi]
MVIVVLKYECLESNDFITGNFLIFHNIELIIGLVNNVPRRLGHHFSDVVFDDGSSDNFLTLWVDVLEEPVWVRRWVFRVEQRVVNSGLLNWNSVGLGDPLDVGLWLGGGFVVVVHVDAGNLTRSVLLQRLERHVVWDF